MTTAFQSLTSTVKVEYGYVTGSGFVIETGLHPEKKIRYYKVLTCAHVVESPPGAYVGSPIVVFSDKGEKTRLGGKILKINTESDLALIEVWQSDDELRYLPFKIAPNDDNVKYFSDVILVSYPQGLGPIATRGMISGIDVLPWDEDGLVATSQSAPGSSGGPLVATETGEVIGVLRAVLRRSGEPGVLNWFSILVPPKEIRNFLSSDQIKLPGGISLEPGADRGTPSAKEIFIFTPFGSLEEVLQE